MDVGWQDSVGSFLDSSGSDPGGFASFASGDGSVLWSSAGDSPFFSGQPVLWESSADSPGDSRSGWLTLDSANGTDIDSLSLASSNSDGTAGFAGSTLNSGLLWAGAGGDASSSPASNGGLWLGALDLGAGSSTSQWQPFASDFATQSASGLADAQHLLWTGASSQPAMPAADGSQPVHIDPSSSSQAPITVPVSDGSLPLHVDPNNSLSVPTLGSVSPAQLTWTQPAAAPAPTTWIVGDTSSTWISSLANGTSSNSLPNSGLGLRS